MCVIIHKPANVILEENVLRMCWDSNHDGAGFMYSDNEKLIVRRGYMKYKRFKDSYDRFSEKEMVIHFRWASCGIISPNMCHPFKINENLAIAHNGHINVPFKMGKEESDSLWIVKNIFTKFPDDFINKPSYLKLITMAIEGSVMVFMDNYGKVTKIGDKGGFTFKKCWFSNSYWITEVKQNISTASTFNEDLTQLKYIRKGYRTDEIAQSYIPSKI